MTIIHGEHQLQSRNALVALLERAAADGLQVTRVDAKSLDLAALSALLQSQSLFGGERLIVIEELHSLPKSKKKEQMIALAAKASAQLVLWEKKQLSVTELKQFPAARVQAFQPNRVMFTWLGSVSGQATDSTRKRCLELLRQAVATDGEQFCFAMLIRQVRLLMDAKEGKGPPASPKLISQARTLSWPQLFHLHKQLLFIDTQQKTSAIPLSLVHQLELLLTTL